MRFWHFSSRRSLPKWFRDLFAKNQDEKDRAYIISHTIERTFMYEDVGVPLYSSLVKMILTRKWMANDLGRRLAYIVHALIFCNGGSIRR